MNIDLNNHDFSTPLIINGIELKSIVLLEEYLAQRNLPYIGKNKEIVKEKPLLREQERLLIYHNGEPRGIGVREDVHIQMIQHASVQFGFITDDNYFVGQQRNVNKINGLCLDQTGAGHMKIPKEYWSVENFAKQRGFTYNADTKSLITSYYLEYLNSSAFKRQSVLEEAQEETNVKLLEGNLNFVGEATYRQVIQPENNKGVLYANNELANVFTYRISYDQLQEIYMTDGEASAIFLMKVEEFFRAAKKDHENMKAAFEQNKPYDNVFVPRFPVYDVLFGGLQRN